MKNLLLELKWQIYRPIIWIQYGWGYLVVDLFLDFRGREDERKDLQEGWKTIKDGIILDDPHQVAEGQAEVKTQIYTIMNEAMMN